MKNRPIAIIVVSVLFIVAGITGFAYHIKEYFDPNFNKLEIVVVLIVRVLAVVCGILLFYGINWARWLAVIWILYHIILSFFHSTSEVIMHILLLIVVSVMMFHPKSAVYFKRRHGAGLGSR
jgi:hypothetical protein